MKTVVVGYGSIGQRHAEVLSEQGHEVAIVSRRDINHQNRFSNIEEAVNEFQPSYTIIASSTNEHQKDIQGLSDTGFTGLLMIEKPVYAHGIAAIPSQFSRAKVAFNLRFHPALLRFREELASREVHTVSAYVGSYLPSWRPTADYRKGYSANPSRGGGVLRDLSHELDFLLWIFGDWNKLTSLGGHFSNLEISSDDVYSILFATDRVPAISLNMNYLDTTTRRNVTALTDKGSVHLDLVQGTVSTPQGTETYSVERNDTYNAQHAAMLKDDNTIICDISEGLKVMRMIDAVENAAQQDTWVYA